MSLFSIKKSVLGLSIALILVLLGSSETNAQSRREIERERQRESARWEHNRQRQVRQNRPTRPTMSRREFANAYFASGYQQGYLAGTSDGRRRKYNRSNVYRNTGSYPNQGDPTSGDYLYRQGYLAGYEDGYHGRRNY